MLSIWCMKLIKKVYLFLFISSFIILSLGCQNKEGMEKKEEQNLKEQFQKENQKEDNLLEIEKSGEEEEVSMANPGIEWIEDVITVYTPDNGGVWYPRMYQLKDGTILCGFDTNEDGGRAVIKMVSSEDGGYTWSKDAIIGTSRPEYDCANANFIELPNGDIWLAYRANVTEGEDYYSSIRVNVSKDRGKTWEEHSVVAEEKGQGEVYEPQFQYIEEEIAIFYANDSLNAVKNNRQQNIEYKIWNGDSWSSKYIAVDGTKTNSRDGMPVLARLSNGSYGLVIESTTLHPSYEFIIQLKVSPDGHDWSGPLKNIYVPNKLSKKAGAPYIITLSDGRLLVSFQTDEDSTKNGDAFSKMKVMLSTDSSGSEFLSCTEPFDTPDGYCSSWNSLLSYKDSVLAVASTNYPKQSIILRRGEVTMDDSKKENKLNELARQLYQADPTIFYEDGMYYLYGTNELDTSQGFYVYTSKDLIHWVSPDGENNRLALKKGDSFGSGNFWAPQVFYYKDSYYMAYTADEQIAIAKSSSPLGPFIQSNLQPSFKNAEYKTIDPYVFIDEDGQVYLYFVKQNGGNNLYVVSLNEDLTGFEENPHHVCIVATESWENTAKASWPVTEGPTVIKRDGTYYLFYSANDFRNPDYAVGYATSQSPLGPWEKQDTPIISRNIIPEDGTGHGDIFAGQNNQLYYVLHTHFKKNQVLPRKTAIVNLLFTPQNEGAGLFSIAPESFYYTQKHVEKE